MIIRWYILSFVRTGDFIFYVHINTVSLLTGIYCWFNRWRTADYDSALGPRLIKATWRRHKHFEWKLHRHCLKCLWQFIDLIRQGILVNKFVMWPYVLSSALYKTTASPLIYQSKRCRSFMLKLWYAHSFAPTCSHYNCYVLICTEKNMLILMSIMICLSINSLSV